MHAAPWLAVRDVQASKRWYKYLLELESDDSDPDHPHRQEFDLLFSESKIVLMFHAWKGEPDIPLDRWFSNPEEPSRGHGIVLSFPVADFDAAKSRVRELKAEKVEDEFVYPDGTRGLMLRDPDGYALVIVYVKEERTLSRNG
jgi:hypothetical protein